ncbi:MAG: hypothetical protein ACXABY_19825 [Candidatus Thorarchaeota archaeon]|jgi:hypothetical protein
MLRKKDKPTKIVVMFNKFGHREEVELPMTEQEIDEVNAMEELFEKMATRIGEWKSYGEIDNGALLMRHESKSIIGTFFVN